MYQSGKEYHGTVNAFNPDYDDRRCKHCNPILAKAVRTDTQTSIFAA